MLSLLLVLYQMCIALLHIGSYQLWAQSNAVDISNSEGCEKGFEMLTKVTFSCS